MGLPTYHAYADKYYEKDMGLSTFGRLLTSHIATMICIWVTKCNAPVVPSWWAISAWRPSLCPEREPSHPSRKAKKSYKTWQKISRCRGCRRCTSLWSDWVSPSSWLLCSGEHLAVRTHRDWNMHTHGVNYS